MKFDAYFEIPDECKVEKKVKSQRGGSPKLLSDLINVLDGASEIKLSFFLYNNPYLHEAIEKIIEKGHCKVEIYTIPLNGYSTEKVLNVITKGEQKNFSKWDYADKIFSRVAQRKDEKIELRYVLHTNLWYKQKTSRGLDSYALHNKSILVKYPNKPSKCISSSSNFAFGDPLHSENFFITERLNDIQMFEAYFQMLYQHSIDHHDYNQFSKNKSDFEYVTKPINLIDTFHNCYFTAPFIKYNNVGSNHYVQQKVIDFIQQAKTNLYFCFQHVSNINSFDNQAKSVVDEVCNIAKANPTMDIKIMKQTRANHQKQGNRTTQAEKALKNHQNIKQKFWSPVIHDKFIIADNNLMVTTANLTSTQFAWAENYPMVYKKGNTKQTVTVYNTFSDINSFHFIYEENQLTDAYKTHFDALWRKASLI